MVDLVTLNMVKIALKDKIARPAWQKNFGKVIEVREIPVTKTRNMFLAYLDNGTLVNAETLKDKDNKYILDNLGGELVSTHKDEDQ